MSDPVVQLEGLRLKLPSGGGWHDILCGVELALHRGRSLGLLGASGSGKTLTALALMGLLPRGSRLGGSIRYQGQELVGAPEATLRALRGSRLAMVFQEPALALNPVLPVVTQVAEVLVAHRRLPWRDATSRARELLGELGLPEEQLARRAYPFELSGGQRQRVALAMALCCDPDVLVADEPTSALDVTVQAHLLQLLRTEQRERGMAMLFITHDVALLPYVADEVAVLCEGRIVEQAPLQAFVAAPSHSASRELLAAARAEALVGHIPCC
jgi:ABC-type glutathione transport system ATPase component